MTKQMYQYEYIEDDIDIDGSVDAPIEVMRDMPKGIYLYLSMPYLDWTFFSPPY